MTDRELLEMAAKAAGVVHPEVLAKHLASGWNPLTNDGDALRLAVKLNMDIRFHPESEICEPWVETAGDGADADEALNPDPYAATRRAIVRAAAEIGRSVE